MDKDLFDKAMSKIPEVVATMSNYYNEKEYDFYKETIMWYSPSGYNYSTDYHTVNEGTMLELVKRSKKEGFSIDVTDTEVIVTKPDKSVIVTFTPIETEVL